MQKSRQEITVRDIAAGYDAIAGKVFVSRDFYNEVLDIGPRFFGDILEIGVGQGVVLKTIAERGGAGIRSLTGIDLSPRLIGMARVAVPQARIVEADAAHLPFADASFDLAVMVDTFQYVLDPRRVLEEVRRVLRPGGKFLVTVPNRKWILFSRYIKTRKNIQPVEDKFYDYAEMSKLLADNRFAILKFKGADALRFYTSRHRYERALAVVFPFLHRYMKKLVFLCTRE